MLVFEGLYNFLPVLHVFEVKESISDILTELPCLCNLENLGQLQVLLPILALIVDTVALVAGISVTFHHSSYFQDQEIHFLQFHRDF